MFFFKKQRLIIAKIEEYLAAVDHCIELFRDCVECLIERQTAASCEDKVEAVHKAESRADDLKREIEYCLYQNSLIPESRGDVLGILETLDKVPNMMEKICFQIYLQKTRVPRILHDGFFKLIGVNLEAYSFLKQAVKGLFYNKEVINEIKRIDSIESESDRLERFLMKELFLSDLDLPVKLVLKDLIQNIGHISDRIQVVSDRVSLAVIKRKI
jgi:predicted phosphate transport protein (TIGR00153 family)